MKYTSREIQPAESERYLVALGGAPAETTEPVRTYTSLQQHFLSRLQRLRDAKHELDAAIGCEDGFMKRLVDRGLFATYRECIDEGVGTEARQILRI